MARRPRCGACAPAKGARQVKVVYPGHMPGYHVIGRRGVGLKPGVNEVDHTVGMALIANEIVIPIEETHHRELVADHTEESTLDVVDIGDIEPVGIDPDGRAEGAG